MSVNTENSSGGSIPRKRVYPLKMETLPMASDGKEIKESQNIATSTQKQNQEPEPEPEPNIDMNEKESQNSTTSDFENDYDFRFKRHKINKINGVPSLGERLDNLQDMKKAKWVENFDSSMPRVYSQNISSTRKDKYNNPQYNDLPSSQPNVNMGEIPYLGANQWQQPIYYIPMPASPLYASQLPGGTIPSQYINQSMPVLPNSSLQPFYPQPSIPGSSQLLPPPQLNSANLQYVLRTRHDRKSIAEQRGRRLSIMSNRDQTVISPHNDVPEDQFYRHLGNTSFAPNLQLKQLFTWCTIRGLEKMRHDSKDQEKFDDGLSESFVETKWIALSIIGEFVDDLRRGHIDIDWEAEDLSEISKKEIGNDDKQEEAEDTVLRNLFADDDDSESSENNTSKDLTYYYTGLGVKKITKKKSWTSKTEATLQTDKDIENNEKKEKPLLPNSKNVKNEQNLMILVEKVDKLKKEIEDWIEVLDNQKPEVEWESMSNLQKDDVDKIKEDIEQKSSTDDLLSIKDLEQDLVDRMNRLAVHSHLIKSHSEILSKTTSKNVRILSKEFMYRESVQKKTTEPKLLLRGLSQTLANK